MIHVHVPDEPGRVKACLEKLLDVAESKLTAINYICLLTVVIMELPN